jgi:hypothetical protein
MAVFWRAGIKKRSANIHNWIAMPAYRFSHKTKENGLDILQYHHLALALSKLAVESYVEKWRVEANEVFVDVKGFFFRVIRQDYRNKSLRLSAIPNQHTVLWGRAS